jgi:hypothetical protein
VHGRTVGLLSLLLIGFAALALAACGGDSDPVTVTETTETPTVNDSSEEIDELEEQVEDLQDEADADDDSSSLDEPEPSPPTDDEGGTGGVPADAKSCGSGVFVEGSTTSCDFGLVVAQDYFASGGGDFESFSPATGKNYSMSCSDGSPITCTGGDGAVVYIASS